ncbi:FemAB family XrtA/PEP-CTERM system-associated protein [Candidatus Laterigemmans baculatus]|uniref:FemAB family XrtA/PEP-CTERM system-associated protein n=1 Tax=Candidatus Laterigemmans baculatus TaxID=2770505 RepID=UPI0013D9A952|nr:FemAB family XrtA/PEP-CTERM system-associated protein [Candidatus Laterigemmans baculatus]
MDQLEVLDWPVEIPTVTQASYPRLNGHHDAWIEALAKGFAHPTYLLQTSRERQVTGTLPLMLVKSRLFGRFLVSLPYLNTGGVWADNDASAKALVDGACELADRLDVRYLELRHERPVEHPRLNFRRNDKLHMRLPLPATADELHQSLKSKLRSQVKKAGEYGSTVHWGGKELLAPFYSVFARNMRDLGTPVFSQRLFASILDAFAGEAELCVVRQGSTPIAAALLVHLEEVSEVPSASSLREYNRTNANMLMYWHLLQRSIERGSATFDFGRSSLGSGTFKFKAQWGAEPHPAEWQYYVRSGSVEAMRPDSAANQRLIRIWQRLPVWLTRLAGPPIVRGIP